MRLPKLTKQITEALRPEDADYVAWCGKIAGFGIRVRRSGHKSFVAQYRLGGRNSSVQKVTIGTFGKIPFEQAKLEASKVLAKAKLGEDVAARRAQIRAEMTVAQLCEEYLSDGVDHKKRSTIEGDRSRISAHILPLLGNKRIGEIKKADVEKFLRDVANGKTMRNVKTKRHGRSKVRGGRSAATRTVRLLGGIFSYSVSRSYLKDNPRQGVVTYKDKRGETFLSSEQFKRLGDTIALAETEGLPWSLNDGAKANHRPIKPHNLSERLCPFAISAIRLLIFTGCRVSEILKLKWAEVDLERGILNLADSKTGKKTVFLSGPAVAILATLPRAGSYVIVGGKAGQPRTDLNRPWNRIRKHAGLAGVRLHDLRHSYASVGAASGVGLMVIGKLLGHTTPATTARYAHLADSPVRRGANEIAALIAEALSPSFPAPTPQPSEPQ